MRKRGFVLAALMAAVGAAVLLGNSFFESKRAVEEEQQLREIHLGTFLEDPIAFPKGETMEDNRFLDWIREDLNIQVIYDWIYSKDEFQRNIDLYIACDMLPDALLVEEAQYRKMLEYDLLQPVTDVYQTIASSQLKDYVESIGEEAFETVMENGEMMAIPFPSLTASGVNVMWIRQDWLDELGLEVPETVEEIGETADIFVKRQMGGQDTIGILGPGLDGQLVDVGKCSLGFNPVFNAYHVYPKYWIMDEQGDLVYGSIQEGAKQALQILADWYQEGILDPQIFSRENSQEVLDQGKAGIFFGPWWAAEMLEQDIAENGAVWKAYAAPRDTEGIYSCSMPAIINQYLVISKECQDPEGVVEIVNYGIQNQYQWVSSGMTEGVNMKAYPLGWECDFADELEYTCRILKASMSGEEIQVDFTGHKVLKQDLDMLNALNKPPLNEIGAEDWDPEKSSGFIRLYGIVNGVGAIIEEEYQPVYNMFAGETETMKQKWKELERLENEVYAKIILGQESIQAFDEFVETWKKEGGTKIEQEILKILEE